MFRADRAFDPAKLEDFLGAIVNIYGPRMLRYKGVLHMKGTERKVIFQGVHQLMGSDLGPQWADGEKRLSKMVFIGIDLPKEARPQDILIVKGDVKDEAGKAVTDATVSITYMDTRKTEVLKVDPADGHYATVVNLKAGSDVIVTVKKSDHVFDSRSYSLEDTVRGGVVEADMKLEKIEVGKSYRVNDIKYATNSAEITGASRFILDELIIFLKENPTVRIEVQGHTDNVGDMESNMTLSRDRALTVAEYLTGHSIKASRLTSNGYGPTVPIASNSTEEGRAENRRTTFVITSR